MEETLRKILEAAALRNLSCLLIGGNALILLGYIRNTFDLDLLVQEKERFQWLDVMRKLEYRFFHGMEGFAQFEAPTGSNGPPVDLMFVNSSTWDKLRIAATATQMAGKEIFTPSPEHLVALKLHAAGSPTRTKPEQDWEDIRQIVCICGLDPADPSFRTLILNYGGENALQRIESLLR